VTVRLTGVRAGRTHPALPPFERHVEGACFATTGFRPPEVMVVADPILVVWQRRRRSARFIFSARTDSIRGRLVYEEGGISRSDQRRRSRPDDPVSFIHLGRTPPPRRTA
jgi:hypothetical protein